MKTQYNKPTPYNTTTPILKLFYPIFKINLYLFPFYYYYFLRYQWCVLIFVSGIDGCTIFQFSTSQLIKKHFSSFSLKIYSNFRPNFRKKFHKYLYNCFNF